MNQQRILSSILAMMVILSSQLSFARSTSIEKARVNTNELNRLVSEAAAEHYIIAQDRENNVREEDASEITESTAVTVEIGEE